MNQNLSRVAAAGWTSMALALGGCASFSADGGFDTARSLTRARVGAAPTYQRSEAEVDGAQARVAALLARPLSAEAAVEVALLNHRSLQARFADLGIAEAELVQAGRLRNPALGFGRLAGGGTAEIDRSVLFDLLGLLTMPVAQRVEQGRFERARRMVQAGNFSVLSQLREQAFRADAAAQLAHARQQAVAAREGLVRALGLSGAQLGFSLPGRLPDLPAAPAAPRDAEQTAMATRLDVLLAKRTTAALARSLDLTRSTRFVNVLDAGIQDRSNRGEARRDGYRIELELPLFDFGSARTARAEAL